MGKKGARHTDDAARAVEELIDDLAEIPDVRSKKMFGGFGVFAGDTMFALVDAAGTPFLRANDATSAESEKRGADKHGRMPYWSIPRSIRHDPAELARWAARALDIARASKR